MMGRFKQFYALILVMLLITGYAQAQTIRALPLTAKAEHGATHAVVIDYNDFTTTTTNTAETLTVNVSAKQAVQVMGMTLDAAFDTSTTGFTNSLAMTIGDGTDADLYLTSTELASDGSEVWFKFGRSIYESGDTTTVLVGAAGVTNSYVTALTVSSYTLTNMTQSYQAQDDIPVVTNIVLTSVNAISNLTLSVDTVLADTANTLGAKVYTSDDTLDFTFTPDATIATASNTVGQLTVWLRIEDAR